MLMSASEHFNNGNKQRIWGLNSNFGMYIEQVARARCCWSFITRTDSILLAWQLRGLLSASPLRYYQCMSLFFIYLAKMTINFCLCCYLMAANNLFRGE